tara:strand:+ start:24 stop:515 length:492 start_codon:yes stop_codon:yes gene_type:complete
MSSVQTFDFSSVGDTLPTLREHEQSGAEITKVKYGPATPLRLSSDKSELFVMNTNLADMVRDNLMNLLLTNRGERIMQPDFGANLKPILTEFGTDGFESEVMSRIKASVGKYFPYVSLSQMSMQREDSTPESGLIVLTVGITYSIPQVNATNQSVQVTLSTVA